MNALVLCQRRSTTLLFATLLTTAAWAQPKAAFWAKPVSGCSPLVVYFFDSSAGNPSQWKWDLGNGVVSFLRNPSATYFNPGTYTVKLVVSNAGGTDSVVKKDVITVYAAPNPAFSFDKETGCFPLPVTFTDESSAGSGTIVNWQWDFGDGMISKEQNPVHVYKAAGTFSATLRVTNSFGCAKSIAKNNVIQISDGVKAAFSNSSPGVCPAPVTIRFTNSSSGPGPLRYHWDFGDGNISTDASPAHRYTASGSYAVTLIATSPQGCVDTVRKDSIVNIGRATPDFSVSSDVCTNEPLTLTNTSAPAPASVRWNFGDGTTSTQLHPTKIFTRSGVFTIQLINEYGACSDTVEKTIQVAARPSANFTAEKEAPCRLPVAVQFRPAALAGISRFQWNFGDGTTDTTAAPLHHYTAEGTYSVSLVVTGEGGCMDTVVQKNLVTIQKPALALSGLPKSGCLPVQVRPSASFTNGQTITSYQWHFGDGTVSAAAQPAHTYSKAGSYDIRLVVTTANGCTDSVIARSAVRVGEKPKTNFTLRPQMACPFEKVFFFDSSRNADQWLWQFGDGGTSTEQNPVHQYSDTGWQTVTLIALNNTCPDTLVVKKAVYVNPPIASFQFTGNCTAKFTKQFTDLSLGAKSWFWEFGDGSTSTEKNPQHNYPTAGKYSVKLTVTNGDCSHYMIKTVLVIDEIADFSTADTVICRNTPAQFVPSGFNSDNISGWNWQFGDGGTATTSGTTSYVYKKAGKYNPTLTITDILGCASTKTLAVTVFGPTARFSPSASATCLPNNKVTFTDASATDGNHPIVKWRWDYGDKTTDTSGIPPFQHSYSVAGAYIVKLVVTDAYGCTDSLSDPAPVMIAQPRAAFTVSDTVSCTGKSIQFTNASQGHSPSFQWWFGNGKGSVAVNPVHAYGATGVYTVTLVATDQFGCTDSVVKRNLLAISYPQAALKVSDSTGTCPPLLVHFTHQSTDYTSIAWDFGDGNRSGIDTPSHFYTMPGTYYAKIIATTHGGCTDTARQKIVVRGPTGSFHYPQTTGCKPLTVDFTANTPDNVSYIWDFSDGTTQATQKPAATHTYTVAGDFVPRLILTDAGGCSVPIEGKDTIRVKGVSTDLVVNNHNLCDSGRVQFTNRTVSNDLIAGYFWRFGDGTTSKLPNPAHVYRDAGTYAVTLEATTASGCVDSITLPEAVHVWSSPVVQILGDTTGCAPASFSFNGGVVRGDPSVLQWAWNLGNGQYSSLQQPAPSFYTAEGSYTISATATDDHGCVDTAFRMAIVHPEPTTSAGADQWICRGSFYQLKATGADAYEWTGAPSLSCTNCDAPLAAPTDSTTYVVTGSNRFGCSRTDSVTIRVHQPFTLTVGRGDTICTGKTVALFASGAEQYTWLPSTGVKNTSAASTTATPTASTHYKVVAKDNVGCFTDTGYVFIKVWPIPTIRTEALQTMSVGNPLTLKPAYSADVSSYQWSNAATLSCHNCPWPVAAPKTETEYGITVKNDGGCIASEAITVRVVCNGGNLFIPNTFSPNADGRNDRFYPRGTGIGTIKSLTIFNRWGEVVFSRERFNANDAAAGWDGTHKGALLTPDVYVYTCEVICQNNEVLTYKGDVTLLR